MTEQTGFIAVPDQAARAAQDQRRFVVVNLVLGIAVLVLGAGALVIGYVHLPASEVFASLAGAGDAKIALIVHEIRLPRAILGILVGASLGLSGAALQGLLRNPLAEPGLIGVSASGGLGAVIALYFGLAAAFPLALPMCAMGGALVSTTLLYVVASRDASTLTLILVGVAISGLAVALTSLALNLSPNAFAQSEMVMWLLGSLKDRSFDDVSFAAPFTVLGWFLLLSVGRSLDALSLGEDTGRSLGVSLTWLRARVIGGVTLAVGSAVAVSGTIGFVGLVVPHLIRPFVGYQPGQLLLPSALAGAVLLLAADIAVRLVSGESELMLGVVTSLIGAPFFLHLILKTRRTLR